MLANSFQLLTEAVSKGLGSTFNVLDYIPEKFSGEQDSESSYLTWKENWSQVETRLQELGRTPSQMLLELKKTLKGTALLQMQQLQINDQNYPVALEMLDQLYCNIQSLMRSLVNQLIEQPTVRDDLNELRHYYATVTTMRQRFIQLQVTDEDLATLFFVTSMEKRMPTSLTKAWHKQVVKFDSTQTPGRFQQLPLETFFQVILQEIKRLTCENAIQTRKDSDEQEDKKPRSKNSPTATTGLIYATSKEGKAVQCFCSKKPHLLHGCNIAKAMDAEERITEVKKKKLCWGCLQPLSEIEHDFGHCFVKCEAKGCRGSHHPFFHEALKVGVYKGSSTVNENENDEGFLPD